MSRRPLPPELGERLSTERPLPTWVALVVPLVPAVAVVGTLWVLDPGGPRVFLLSVLVALWGGFLGIVVEPLGYRHHVHEAGIVSESFRPFPRRIIPFYTVDASSFDATGYERTGTEVGTMMARRHRQIPGVRTLRFDGLRVDRATALARGRATWNSAPYEEIWGGGGQQEATPAQWLLAWRRPAEDLDRLADLVARYEHPWDAPAGRAGVGEP